jgi:hypothetical protein
MKKLKTILIILALPWIFFWIILRSGFDIFKDTGGHTAGIAAGFMIIGAFFALAVGIGELIVAGLVIMACVHFFG